MRPSVGRTDSASSSALSPTGPVKANCEPFFSSERRAFWRASVKFRPMAMASPTDFMVVVRVASAEGNFSKAKRGALTTT